MNNLEQLVNVAGVKVSLKDMNTIFKSKPSLAQYFKSIIEETLPTINNKEIKGVVVDGVEYISNNNNSFCDVYFNLMNKASKFLSINLMIEKFTGTIKLSQEDFVSSARPIDYREINGGWLYMRSSNQDKCDVLKKLYDYKGLPFEIIYS